MQRRIFIDTRSIGWPERLLGGVAAVLILMLGLAFGTLALGLGLVLGLGFAIRLWWMRRQLRHAGVRQDDPHVIDGEFRILERHRTTRMEGFGA